MGSQFESDHSSGSTDHATQVSVLHQLSTHYPKSQQSDTVLSIDTDDSYNDDIQHKQHKKSYNNNNPYDRSIGSIHLGQHNLSAAPSLEDFILRTTRTQDTTSKTSFLERYHHSNNIVINTAFEQRRKAHVRKNRAVDWLLSQPAPDTTKIKESIAALEETAADVQEALERDEQTRESVLNETWGDVLSEKTKNYTRIYFQNVRGLQLTKRSSTDKWASILEYANRHSFDIMGLAETCTNTNHHRVRHRLQAVTNQAFIQTNLCWSDNDFITDTSYRPGGTLVATMNSWVGRINRALNDPYLMGRWSGNEYNIGYDRRLFLFSAYRVCKQSPTLGLISSYRQQVLKLYQRGLHKNPCPRKYFILDLIDYIRSLKIKEQDFILIMIDANEQFGEDSYGISTLTEKLGLVDLFTRHHQLECNISTHQSSHQKRIDFMIGSESLLHHISSCGYLPFFDGVDSDHRGLFIDFKQSLTDGQARIQRPPYRRIGTNTSRKEVYAYKQYLTQQFREADIFARAEALYMKAKENKFTTEDLNALNDLDAEVTGHMLKAEIATCSEKPPTPWTPAIHQAALVIQYWTLQYRNRNINYDIAPQLGRIVDSLDTKYHKCTIQASGTARTNLHKAKLYKQRLQMESILKRQNHRREFITQEAEFRNTKEEHEASRLAMKAETNHLYRYLEKIYGKRRNLGVSGIEIPFQDQDGNLTEDPNAAVTWIKVHDPDTIINHLIRRNIQHFGQAEGSPFTRQPIKGAFGYRGIGPTVEAMLSTNQIPSAISEQVSEGTQLILNKLTDGNSLPTMSDNISCESFWKAMRVWDEQTSTSPSGRHLGHYKALLMADGQDHTYNKQNNVNPRWALQRVYFHIALAATRQGNTLKRWCQSSTMMLEKTPGQPRIHKLRVIHIFEADYNLMLKLLWSRRLVWHAHKKGRFHEAQAGSRPDHRCIDVVLRKTMNYEYAALTRTPLITIDNDAKACYDRIVCNLAMVVSRYFGMTERGCSFHSKTLQQMKFRIRTAAGDSQAYYRHSEETPIHGTGQGSCASPSIWLMLSSLLMECHTDRANGMTQHDIWPQAKSHFVSLEGFVDDVSINFINFKHFSLCSPFLPIDQLVSLLTQLIQLAKQYIRLWQTLLEASGGKLELAKCFWYLLWWRFNRFGDPYCLCAWRRLSNCVQIPLQ